MFLSAHQGVTLRVLPASPLAACWWLWDAAVQVALQGSASAGVLAALLVNPLAAASGSSAVFDVR